MTGDGGQWVYELRGGEAAPALDWLHVHADVLGAIEDDEAIVVWLAAECPALPFAGVAVRQVEVQDTDRVVTGLEHDAPILVADDLLVRPPWVDRPRGFAGVELVVPRGGAFGSGEHASTRAALRCLHRLWNAPPTFVDVGTGSGILALYASVRGCHDLQACDIDPASVAAARELLPAARVVLGGPELLAPADAVVANMTADELHASWHGLLRLWRPRGLLVLGGLRAHEIVPLLDRIGRVPVHREAVEAFTSLGFLDGST